MTDIEQQVEKAFKVLDDKEAAELGLPTEPTPEDIAEGERARAAAAEGVPALQPSPEQSPLVAPRPKRWDELPPRVRAELEAGRAALGSGGLSAEEAYNKSIAEVPPPPLPPPEMPEPQAEPTERTRTEMAAGAASLRRHQDEIERSQRIAAELRARAVEAGAPASATTDLNYTAPKV